VPARAPVTAADVLRQFNAPGGVAHSLAKVVADAAVADAARYSTAELIGRFRITAPQTVALLRDSGPAKILPWPAANAPVRLDEVLRIAVMEATVHLLDLLRALDRPPEVPAGALRITGNLLLDTAGPVEFLEAATGRSATSPLPVLLANDQEIEAVAWSEARVCVTCQGQINAVGKEPPR
jgi:Mycothiol maleylpyruvate isomerase N-terminal domain